MSVNQWTVDEFVSHRPVFRTSWFSKLLLTLAYAPFGIGAMYWVSSEVLVPYFGAVLPVIPASIFVGWLIAATASMVTAEWLEAQHYSRLHRKYDVIGRCETLLREALGNEAFIKERYANKRPSLISELQSTAASSVGRLHVDERNEAEVLVLINAWSKMLSDSVDERLNIAERQQGQGT